MINSLLINTSCIVIFRTIEYRFMHKFLTFFTRREFWLLINQFSFNTGNDSLRLIRINSAIIIILAYFSIVGMLNKNGCLGHAANATRLRNIAFTRVD